jgi:UDP-N-acetyl-D-glucosamine dehydrogenase
VRKQSEIRLSIDTRGAAVGDQKTIELLRESPLLTAGCPLHSAVVGADSRAARALEGLRVAVVGLGYVGLPTALSFAEQGAEIIGVDLDEGRLSSIKASQVDLLPRDRAKLAHALRDQLLRLTTEPSAVADAHVVVICVPTPIDHHMNPDLTALASACATLVLHAAPGQTIVLTSTTYPGCTRDLLAKPLESRGLQVGRDVFVAFSPERIDPGVAEHAPEHTPRVVGGVTAACGQRAAETLRHTAGALHLVSSPEVAEMTKLLENTFRAVNIAFANEFADAAREVGVDVIEVISAAATKPYGFMPFYPSAGVGGHCIPCDPHYLLWQLRARRAASPLTEAAMTAIAGRPRAMVTHARRILADHGRPIRGARILIVGVSYKPGVADIRESPALAIIEMLAAEGASVAYADPYIPTLQTHHAGQLFHVENVAGELWDLVLVHTVHPLQDYSWISEQPAVFDMTYRMPGLASRYVL